MSDIMRPVPFTELLKRVFMEYRQSNTIFGIDKEDFFIKRNEKEVSILNQTCVTPVGPAAGPHTQLAQNIIASYLAGGRFFELKTVQKLDHLEIEKPCIDARDEAYNVEWSTEFTLEKAYDEYVKAWIILHVLDAVFQERYTGEPSFIFNMSVGYDLEGIRTPKMQHFIDGMIDAETQGVMDSYIKQLQDILEKSDLIEGLFSKEFINQNLESVKKRIDSISYSISPSLTLSTMHGCPPDEIESICKYMLSEKNLDTFVKLNPTLLGYDKVREILDSLGYDYLHISRESFNHDLQFNDAVSMIKRLRETADNAGKKFGVKLSNTLGSVNDQGVLPGDDMYMSGRALYPLTIHTASKLSDHFDGELRISYSGGANVRNVRKLFEAGIRPITAATELLKPAGYLRLADMAEEIEESEDWDVSLVDNEKLRLLAEESLTEDYTQKSYRGEDIISTGDALPLLDCYIAPCTAACPIHQDVPEYIYLTGQKRFAEALEVIYEKNALPNITGHICDHQCMYNCTRMDYEGAVEIREMKRAAVDNGFEDYMKLWKKPEKNGMKAAVVGAGPAGLSAAYFLAQAGFEVSVFEREEHAGGVVQYVIPSFRLPQKAIEDDIEFIKAHGVTFHFGADVEQVSRQNLLKEGYDYLIYAVGAEKDNTMRIDGDTEGLIESLSFLKNFRKSSSSLELGSHVLVVGGGNTAMDSARAAVTVPGVEQVNLVYRRSPKEMPADLEEYENAVKDGVNFYFLTNPESFDRYNRTVTCRVMKLGAPDSSGRRRPEKTDKTVTITADTIITAVGEKVDSDMLKNIGLPVDEKGWGIVSEDLETPIENVYLIGDAQTGPSTVVQCIAAARKACDSIIEDVIGSEAAGNAAGDIQDFISDEYSSASDPTASNNESVDHGETESDESSFHDYDAVTELEEEENAFFKEIRDKKRGFLPSIFPENLRMDNNADGEFAEREAARCLECSYICNKCVEVCPNRANIAVDVRDLEMFDNPFQIIHIDGYCNECGNCATFCPWEGKPYKDKFTLFNLKEDFDNSDNSGFIVSENDVLIRLHEEEFSFRLNEKGLINNEGNTSSVPVEITELINLIIVEHAYLLGSLNT
ncbi:MAG: putative selenate reductase subunit YgfK [Spirochaetia bacterium]|nr:putative selenate reductase subunit YgfK [Spirochaetia bacterium]MCF7946804.1 putative selenate reductase subunit YgfK [Spirochaetia bacterium]MCF7953187.1 putative selenate reductase subunit YgfK [Spirochaetales bacterium]